MVGGPAKANAWALVAWLMACPMHCGAAELIATVQGGDIGVEIRGLQLPETLRTELASGLTNRIVVRTFGTLKIVLVSAVDCTLA